MINSKFSLSSMLASALAMSASVINVPRNRSSKPNKNHAAPYGRYINASRSRVNQETANELRRRKQQCEAYNRFVGQHHVRLTRTGRIKNDWDHTEMMAQVGKY